MSRGRRDETEMAFAEHIVTGLSYRFSTARSTEQLWLRRYEELDRRLRAIHLPHSVLARRVPLMH